MRRRASRDSTDGRLIRSSRAIVRRLAAGITGVPIGFAIGREIVDGELLALAAAAVSVAVLIGIVRRSAPPGDRMWLSAVVLFAFAARLAVAVLFRDISVAFGHDGTTTGDDHDYFRTSWGIAEYLRGAAEPSCVPPTWCGGGYLLGTFVYLESFVFFVVGKQLLIMLTLNAALGAGLVILVRELAHRIWDGAHGFAASVAIATYPGLILFSALNIKDPLIAVLTSSVLLLLVAFRSWPRWLLFLGVALTLELLHSLRQYVFAGLAIVAPIAVSLAPGQPGRRIKRTAIAVAVCGSLFLFNSLATESVLLTDKPLDTLEYIRAAMSRGRTGFADVVPTTIPTSRPTTRATTVPVAGSTPRATTVPTSAPTTVATTAPRSAPSNQPQESSGEFALNRTLSYLPRGLAYAFFAPFPWAADRLIDVLVVPDTLMWYLLLTCGMWSISTHRRRWRAFLPAALFVLGTMLLFALFEGNVGTLYRHRAITVVPVLAILAAPGLTALRRRLADWTTARAWFRGARRP